MKPLRWAVALFLAWGCRRELPLPDYEPGLSLFPIEGDHTWVYEVRETTYTTAGAEPHLFYLRMRLDTPVIDAYGRPNRYVVWDTAASLAGQWGFFRVGMAYRDSTQAELWENNRRLLMLRFPLSPALRWNRHEYTDLPTETCQYLSTDTTYRLGARTFPKSAIVLRRLDTLGLLQKAYFYEVYARGIGLTHRYERLDVYDLRPDGSLIRSTDSYYREWRLVEP